jgi:hypothetical protein
MVMLVYQRVYEIVTVVCNWENQNIIKGFAIAIFDYQQVSVDIHEPLSIVAHQ